MLWEDLLSCHFLDAVKESKGVCAIPIGCVEAHGKHLPLGCDTIKALELVRRAAEQEPVCVFPAMYFGEKSGAGEFPGTIIFPTQLIWAILEQSCFEIARNGFKKIVLVTSHGGNKAMADAFCRVMLQKKPDFLIYHYYQAMSGPKVLLEELDRHPDLNEEDIAILQSYVDAKKAGGHGCFTETNCLYDICPEKIDLQKFKEVDGTSTHAFDEFTKLKIYTPFTWMANYPNSLGADYHEGVNPRIAKAVAASTVARTAEVFRFLRNETLSTEYHKKWLAKQVPHVVEP